MEHLRRHRTRSSSSSSASPDITKRRSFKKRVAVKLGTAVAGFIIAKKLRKYERGEKRSGSSSDEEKDHHSHKATKIMMLAVAKHLLDKRHQEHKYRKQVVTYQNGQKVVGAPYTTEDIGAFTQNKELVKSLAMSIYPMIKTQVKSLKAQQVVNPDGTITTVHPKMDKTMIKAIALNAQNFITAQFRASKAATNVGMTVSQPVTTTTTATTVVANDGLSRSEMLKAKANMIMSRLHGNKTFSEEEVIENPHKHRALKVGAAVASAYLLKKALGARKHRKTVTVEGKSHKIFRRSVSSSSSSSSDEEGHRTKNAVLTTVASGVARHMLTKMNRRRERKVLRREERIVTEPSKLDLIKTKLAEHRARSSSSSSSSSDEETHTRKKVLLATTAGVAEHLMRKRLDERRHRYTEQEYTSRLGGIKDKLTRTRSISVSSDEDEKASFKNKALVTAATLMIQQLIKKQYRKTYATPVVADEQKRHTAYRWAASLAAQVALKKLLKQRKHRDTTTISTHSTGTHISKAEALKEALRHRSVSSSSSSSSSDEESHKMRKLAVLMGAARIAQHAAVKGHRRAERKVLRRQVVVETEPSKLHMLKDKLATLRAASSSSSSSSSDEESHKKKAILLASTAAVAAALLRKRYHYRKPLYTEQLYAQKVASIPQVVSGTTVADLSGDEAIRYGRRSGVMLGAQKMYNRLSRRTYRDNYDAYAGQYAPNTWVKLNQGVALSLGRDSIKRRHLRHGVASTDPVFVNSDPTRVGTTPGFVNQPMTTNMPYTTSHPVTTTMPHTTMPHTTTTTMPHTTTTTMPMTYSTTSTTSTTTMPTTINKVPRAYELIDAAVKVKRAGVSGLLYQDLGYFVTLKVDPVFLASQGHIKAGDKIKNLLRLKGPNTLLLDNIIDEPTKLIIKESLGLNPLDAIRLEYARADRLTSSSSSSSANEAYRPIDQTYVTPADFRTQNLSKMERLKAKFHRRHAEPIGMTTSETFVDKSGGMIPTTTHMSTMDKLKSKLHHGHAHPEAL